MMDKWLTYLLVLVCFAGCTTLDGNQAQLPYLGIHEVNDGDTTYYKIPAFTLTNQEGQTINNQTFVGQAYVSDFFFTRCPSICPLMTKNMLRVYETFEDSSGIQFLSHTIDTEYDTVEVLKNYAEALNVEAGQWHFATAHQEVIFELAKNYYVAAMEDEEAPGGYEHSGTFTLVDGEGHVRGFYDGTKSEVVDKLVGDIRILLDEQ